MLVKRNERAIRNYCKDGRLQAGMMLILQHVLNCQHGVFEFGFESKGFPPGRKAGSVSHWRKTSETRRF